MPLVTCPDCGNPVSTQAAACPKCGRPTALTQPPAQWQQRPLPIEQRQPSVGGAIGQGFGWACGCLLFIVVVILVLGLFAVGR